MRVKEMIINQKKFLIVKQILLVSTLGNVLRTVWRIYMVMLGCKGLNWLSTDMKYRMCNFQSYNNDFNRFVRDRIPSLSGETH